MINFGDNYKAILEWHKIGTPEEFWGSEEHQDLCWEVALSEVDEVASALTSEDPRELYKELADCFVTFVPLFEFYVDTVDQVDYPRSSYTNVQRFLMIAYPILKGKKKNAVRDLLGALCRVLDNTSYDMGMVLEKVNKSNMTKYPPIEDLECIFQVKGDEALEKSSKWIEEKFEGRYTNVVGKVINGKCVFRADGGVGKILKPITYREVELPDPEPLGV